jgi:hypothetical protein
MIVFVLTYAILAVLALSSVGSMSAQVSKQSAKPHFAPVSSTSRPGPVS